MGPKTILDPKLRSVHMCNHTYNKFLKGENEKLTFLGSIYVIVVYVSLCGQKRNTWFGATFVMPKQTCSITLITSPHMTDPIP